MNIIVYEVFLKAYNTLKTLFIHFKVKKVLTNNTFTELLVTLNALSLI